MSFIFKRYSIYLSFTSSFFSLTNLNYYSVLESTCQGSWRCFCEEGIKGVEDSYEHGNEDEFLPESQLALLLAGLSLDVILP
jgi:hypothetical protein